MKKEIFKISTLGLLALLLCGLLLYLSFRQETDCGGSCSTLSNDELAFICYSGGEKVIFKNDTTNIFDTLYSYGKTISKVNCSAPCDVPNGRIAEGFSFSHFKGFQIRIEAHNWTPFIVFYSSNYVSHEFDLNVPTQSITVNSTTYNDVYSVHGDSVRIDSNGDNQTIPWKIDYSKSKGFVRFYMINGQTWSKL